MTLRYRGPVQSFTVKDAKGEPIELTLNPRQIVKGVPDDHPALAGMIATGMLEKVVPVAPPSTPAKTRKRTSSRKVN